jgi:hypothetical protein
MTIELRKIDKRDGHVAATFLKLSQVEPLVVRGTSCGGSAELRAEPRTGRRATYQEKA